MNKKAQGLSINTIIIAVIALVVLVVLIAVFTGRIGVFSKGVGDVTGDTTKTCVGELGGELITGDECPEGKVPISSSDSGGNKLCCK